MQYDAAIESDLLSPAARALPPETLAELGALAEDLLGAASTAYDPASAVAAERRKAERAARIIAAEINHLVAIGVVDDVSALVIQSETRGARSHTYKAGVGLVPPELKAQFDALDDETPAPATVAASPARFLGLRSRR